MKIAIIHNLRRGGAARRLQGTIDSLTNRGLVLREFTMTSGAGSISLDGITQAERSMVLNYAPMAPRAPRLLRPALRYGDEVAIRQRWTKLADIVNRWAPDVVFANPCGVLLAAPPALSLLHAPIVYYCDEPRRYDYEQAAHASTKRSTRALYGPLRGWQKRSDRRALQAASRIATNSAHSARGIFDAYGLRATVVPPGVAQCFTYGGEAEPLHVLSVGSLIPTKGHDLVIGAAAEASVGLPVVIVAPRDEPGERARLQHKADTLGQQVRFEIGVSDDALADLYRSAFATAYLARAEPLGLASLESQACGTPVIVADEGGLPDTVDAGTTGYVVARTSEAAAEALRRMAHGNQRATMHRALSHRLVQRDDDAGQGILALASAALEAQ